LNTLKHKYGPLPLWAWLIIALLVVGAIGSANKPPAGQQAIVQPTATPGKLALQPINSPVLTRGSINQPTSPPRIEPSATSVPPLPATSAPPSPTTPPQKAEITVSQQDSYATTGYLYIIGELHNTGNVVLTNLSAKATLFNAAGNVSGSGEDYGITGFRLNPGDYIGFRVQISVASPADAGRFTVQPSGNVYDPNSSIQLYKEAQGLTVSKQSIADTGYGLIKIQGLVNNGAAVGAKLVQVQAACYNKAGKIVDAGGGAANNADPIPAGGSGAFEIDLFRTDMAIAKCDVLARGYENSP